MLSAANVAQISAKSFADAIPHWHRQEYQDQRMRMSSGCRQEVVYRLEKLYGAQAVLLRWRTLVVEGKSLLDTSFLWAG